MPTDSTIGQNAQIPETVKGHMVKQKTFIPERSLICTQNLPTDADRLPGEPHQPLQKHGPPHVALSDLFHEATQREYQTPAKEENYRPTCVPKPRAETRKRNSPA